MYSFGVYHADCDAVASVFRLKDHEIRRLSEEVMGSPSHRVCIKHSPLSLSFLPQLGTTRRHVPSHVGALPSQPPLPLCSNPTTGCGHCACARGSGLITCVCAGGSAGRQVQAVLGGGDQCNPTIESGGHR